MYFNVGIKHSTVFVALSVALIGRWMPLLFLWRSSFSRLEQIFTEDLLILCL